MRKVAYFCLVVVGVWVLGLFLPAPAAFDAQEQLDQWAEEYDLSAELTIQFAGYELQGTYAGYTSVRGTCVTITLHVQLEGTAVARAVLWHEFAHAMEWDQNGQMSDHGLPWMECTFHQPLLELHALLYAFPVIGVHTLWR